MRATDERIRKAYQTLLSRFGPQDCWPGGSRFEIVAGAILTQGTSWQNVVIALERLRESGMLSEHALSSAEPETVCELIRPAGFQRRKQQTLCELARMASRWEGGLDGLLSVGLEPLRRLLISIRGIGPETADAVLLYAGGYPVFVVDSYTMRFASRHRLAGRGSSYDDVSMLFANAMRGNASDMAEFHALLVKLGKLYCRPAPQCVDCPLRKDLGQCEAESTS
ncbi:MAG: endonuclease III domain-containing protein [Candidatus Eisenbacteria bacterium]|nr:endonuclease III domain-containing protein [Candidatus Eisenbacteria bacterium]